jgi:hypothetical protein
VLLLVLSPPDGIGAMLIGSDRAEMRRAIQDLGEVEDFRRGGPDEPLGFCVEAGGLSLFAYFGGDGLCNAIEVGGRDQNLSRVTYDGIDIFGTPADELVRQLRIRTPVLMEQHDHAATAHELLLSVWRSHVPEDDDDDEDEDGRFFDSVLVARPGYYK